MLRNTKLIDQHLPVGIYRFKVAGTEIERSPKTGEEILRVKLKAVRLDDDGSGVVWDRFSLDDDKMLWKIGSFLRATDHSVKDDNSVDWEENELTDKETYLICRESELNESGKRYINYVYCEPGDSRLGGLDEETDVSEQPEVTPVQSNETSRPDVVVKAETLFNRLRKSRVA